MSANYKFHPQSGVTFIGRARLASVALLGALLMAAAPAFAQESDMKGMHQAPPENKPAPAAMGLQPPMSGKGMEMSGMKAGGALPPARSPDYSDGYTYGNMPGMEKSDRIAYGRLLVDELEFLTGNEGEGLNWSAEGSYGGDFNRLWLRTQGLWIRGQQLDPTTDLEALWWHAVSPFWGSIFGLRQDFGRGARTWLAFGMEGLSLYWFQVQLTGYVGEDGRLSARLKTSYQVLFTNRLILTPSLESNVYSRSEPRRIIGSGLGNLELGLRLRYEFSRKFAPYIGFVWERSFMGTADLRRAEGDPVTEWRFVTGIRMLW